MPSFVLGLEDTRLEDDTEEKAEVVIGGDDVFCESYEDDSLIEKFLEDFNPVHKVPWLRCGFSALFRLCFTAITTLSIIIECLSKPTTSLQSKRHIVQVVITTAGMCIA